MKIRQGQIVRIVNEGSGCVFSIIFKCDDTQEIFNEPIYLPEIFFLNFPFEIENPESFIGKRISVWAGKSGSQESNNNIGMEINIFK